MHKSRRVHDRLRRNRVNVAKRFVRQDEFELVASNENSLQHAAVEFVPPDPVDPLPTAGIRVPTTKEARTARGYTIFNNRVVHHESELEHRVSVIIQARPDVRNLISQPYKVRFTEKDGSIAHHIFDFHVEYDDGLRVATAVKPSDKASDLAALLERLVETGQVVRENGKLVELSEAFDRVTIISEDWASLDEYHNACCVRWALRKPIGQACPIVRRRALSLKSTRLRFIDLITGLRDDGSRRIAFWRLVYEGILTPQVRGRIDDLSWMFVNRTSAVPV